MTDYPAEFKRAMFESIAQVITQLVTDSPHGLTQEEIIDEFMKRPYLKQLLLDFEDSNNAVIH